MSRLSKIFSVVLIILILIAFTTPVASATAEYKDLEEVKGVYGEPEEMCIVTVPAAPIMLSNPVGLIVFGVTTIVTVACIIKIGQDNGEKWDGNAENFDEYHLRVQNKVDSLLTTKDIFVDTPEDEAFVEIKRSEYECSIGGDGRSAGSKKDDKWYCKAKVHKKTDCIKYTTDDMMTEEEAIERVRAGKDVYTFFRELAENLATKVSKLNRADRIAEGKKLHWDGDKD